MTTKSFVLFLIGSFIYVWSQSLEELEGRPQRLEYDATTSQYQVVEEDNVALQRSGGTPGEPGPNDDAPAPKGDETNTMDIVGVDPATLAPQGVDLSFIFPEFSFSDDLALKPSLAYSTNDLVAKIGESDAAAVKQWQWHLGELVRSVAGVFVDEDSGKHGYTTVFNTWFVNAQGQQINFFLDPAEGTRTIDDFTHDFATEGYHRRRVWFSEEGNYRLTDLADDTPKHIFQLKTPGGLTFDFEDFEHRSSKETDPHGVAIRYRVTRVTDRLGNRIQATYGTALNQPDKLEGFLAMPDGSQELKFTVSYGYDGRQRLTSITVPAYDRTHNGEVVVERGTDSTNTFHFYYADTLHGLDGAERYEYREAAYWKVPVSTGGMLTLEPAIALGFPVEYREMVNNNNTDVPFLFVDLKPILESGLTVYPDRTRLGASRLLVKVEKNCNGGDCSDYQYFRVTNIEHRNEYLSNRADSHPDRLRVVPLGGSGTIAFHDPNLKMWIYPLLEDEDILVREYQGTRTVLSLDLDNIAVSSGEIVYEDTTLGSSSQIYFLRGANKARIQEIVYPKAIADTGHQRLKLTYDDRTAHHQEIGRIALFHDAISTGSPYYEVRYDYEQIRTLTGDRDEYGVDHYPNGSRNGEPCMIMDVPVTDNWSSTVHIGGIRESDILRRKSVSGLTRNGDIWSSITPLITHYGGAWRWDLATYSEPGKKRHVRFCDSVRQALDGKPFDYTWQINPDGSGTVFDLSPQGLDLDVLTANYNRARRPFKVYTFDTDFGAALFSAWPEQALVGQVGSLAFTRHFEFAPHAPYLDGSTLKSVRHNLEFPYQPRTRADLFSLSSKCYEAQITHFELVPFYRYGLSAVTNPIAEDEEQPEAFIEDGIWIGYAHEDSGRKVGHQALSLFELPAGASQVEPVPLTDAQIDAFFLGTLEATYASYPDSPHELHAHSWPLRNQGSGNSPYYNFYRTRMKVARLKPAWQYTARNLNGFAWDTLSNTIDIDGNHFVSGTRYSNGGYLATGILPGQTVITDRSTSIAGWSWPGQTTPTLKAGDVFFLGNQLLTITGFSGNTISFTPQILGDVVVADGSNHLAIKFYRYFNRVNGNRASNDYIGYDDLGNSSLQKTYIGPMTFSYDGTTGTDPNLALVPMFPENTLATVAWNDSTDPANNDDGGDGSGSWRFFGRVTRSYTQTARPFYLYDQPDQPDPTTMVSGPLDYRFWTTTSYDTTFPWRPVTTTEYHLPLTSTGLPTAHGEDRITRYTWYAPGNTTKGAWPGKLERKVTYKYGNDNHLSIEEFEYENSFGRIWKARQAVVDTTAPNHDNHLTQQKFFYDDNTGLTWQAEYRVGRHAGYDGTKLTWAGIYTQTVTRRHYDLLGRTLREWEVDANYDNFGTISFFSYPNPLEQVVITAPHEQDQGAPTGNEPQFTRTVHYLDGLSRPIASRNQAGPTSDTYETAIDYDGQGRVVREYVAMKVGATAPLRDDLANRAFTRHVYNRRGEAWGRILHASQQTTAPEASNWTVWEQDPTNAGEVFSWTFTQNDVEQAGGGTWYRLDIKQQKTNAFGDLVLVRDYTYPFPTGSSDRTTLYDEDNLPLDNAVALRNLQPVQLTEATYTSDFQGNVVEARVGYDPTGQQDPQTRSFAFDQIGRLRRETHPEMVHSTVYSDFDLHNNPRHIDFGGDRTATWSFNTRGNPRTAQFRQGSNLESTKTWSYTSVDFEHHYPELPELETAVAGHEGVAYRFRYDQDRGHLLEKAMVHNFSDFPNTGYQSTLTNPDWSTALTLTYTYDRAGRITTRTYPTGIAGNPTPTTLEYHYDTTALLSHITDRALSDQVLFNRFSFGPDHVITGYHFAGPDASHASLDDLDAFNRLQTQNMTVGGTSQTVNYDYNPAGKLKTRQRGSVTDAYFYDSLGQLIAADIYDGATSSRFEMQYDPYGCGNLTAYGKSGALHQFSINSANNQLDHHSYTPYGEQETLEQNGNNYTMAYLASGRMSGISLSGGTTSETYIYDAAGMRVLKRHRSTVDETMLYFYDENNRVLCEWVKQDDQTTRWQQSYIYLRDVTALTYEYRDPNGLSPSGVARQPEDGPHLAAPRPTTAEVLSGEDHLTWGFLDGATKFDVQIGRVIEDRLEPKRIYWSVEGQSLKVKLKNGNYAHRVRVPGGRWSEWKTFTVLTRLGLPR